MFDTPMDLGMFSASTVAKLQHDNNLMREKLGLIADAKGWAKSVEVLQDIAKKTLEECGRA